VNDVSAIARRTRSAATRPPASAVCASATMNSSPPQRATKSLFRAILWSTVAEAHLVALESFDRVLTDRTSEAINLGTGQGTTVRELVALFNEVSDTPVQVIEAPRRPGDQVGAYARCDKAAELLGWRSRFSIAEGIADSLRWAEVRDDILTPS
jgi:nucleoside-diphosphate-sugar epimerase